MADGIADITPVSALLDLSGRVAIVTGASGGIGGGIAGRLAEAGAHVVCHYKSSQAAAEAVVDSIRSTGGAASLVRADLSTASGVAEIINETVNVAARNGDKTAPFVLVNNAGEQHVAMLADLDEADWTSMLATNVTAPFLLTKAFAEWLRRDGRSGAVINVASIEAHNPETGHAHYATSKAALLMFTRAAALEFGQYGIRVNSISPGLIGRPGIEQAWPEGVARWSKAAPLGRLGRPQDIADAALFLASDAARWITGADLMVDGGISARPTW